MMHLDAHINADGRRIARRTAHRLGVERHARDVEGLVEGFCADVEAGGGAAEHDNAELDLEGGGGVILGSSLGSSTVVARERFGRWRRVLAESRDGGGASLDVWYGARWAVVVHKEQGQGSPARVFPSVELAQRAFSWGASRAG